MRVFLLCVAIMVAGCSASPPLEATDQTEPISDEEPVVSAAVCDHPDPQDSDEDGIPDACDASAFTGAKPDPWESCERGDVWTAENHVEPTYLCQAPAPPASPTTPEGQRHEDTCNVYWAGTGPAGVRYMCRSVDNFENAPR